MAEQIAQDPNFTQMAQAMQAGVGGVPGMPGMPGAGAGGPAGGPPAGVDPAAYTSMMSGVLQNPQFVEMAEKLGQQIMQVRVMLFSTSVWQRPSCGHSVASLCV